MPVKRRERRKRRARSAVCPHLARSGSAFTCARRRGTVYPGLERCLVDYWNCPYYA